MMRLIELSPVAHADLEAIYGQLVEVAGVGVADQFFAAIRRWRTQLALHPELGRPRRFLRPELAGLRSLNCGGPFTKYLVFYRFDRGQPVMIRILHGARDLEAALLEPLGG